MKNWSFILSLTLLAPSGSGQVPIPGGAAIQAEQQESSSGTSSHEDSPDQPAVSIQTPDGGELTIDGAVAAALQNHPYLQASEAAIQRQQHLVYQATRKPNPTVGYIASEVGNDGEAGQQGVFLSQNIIRGDKLCLSGQVRQRDVAIAMQQLAVRRQQVVADARLAFIDVAVAQERLKLLKRLQRSLDRAVAAVQRLLQSGELSVTSALQSRLEAQRNTMLMHQTETQLDVARARLAAMLGQASVYGDVHENALLPGGEVTAFEDLWLNISSGSPELALAQCRYDKTHSQVRREQAEPTPDLQTQWSLQQDASTDYTVLGIQIGVELPLRDNNAGAISAARADTWRTHHEIEAVRRSLRQRLVFNAGQQQQSREQLAAIKGELEALARENLQTTQKAFALGEASYLDLLNAQRAYIRLSLDTLKLYQQFAVAETHLQTFLVRAAGAISDSE